MKKCIDNIKEIQIIDVDNTQEEIRKLNDIKTKNNAKYIFENIDYTYFAQ